MRVVELGARAHLAPKARDLALDAGRVLAVARPQDLDRDGLSRLLLNGAEHVAEAAGAEVTLDPILPAEETADEALGHLFGPQSTRHVVAVAFGAISRGNRGRFGGAAIAVSWSHDGAGV